MGTEDPGEEKEKKERGQADLGAYIHEIEELDLGYVCVHVCIYVYMYVCMYIKDRLIWAPIYTK